MGPLLIVEDEIAVRDTLTELVAKDGREIERQVIDRRPSNA